MAGGIGSRMKSALPKILHIVDDKPMIYYIVLNAIHLGSSKIMIVVGKYRDVINNKSINIFRVTKIHSTTLTKKSRMGLVTQYNVVYRFAKNTKSVKRTIY